jgi:hypothetical protein
MTRHRTDDELRSDLGLPKCVELGVWVPIPREPPAGPLLLRLKDVDPDESAAVKRRGVMTFHMTGCTGHFGRPVQQAKVAAAMARQIADPRCFGGTKHAVAPSFFYHLGDIVYKDKDKTDRERADQQKLYDEHFYTPYAGYGRSIFAIAGNHDGKDSPHPEKSAIRHFLKNFCDSARNASPDDPATGRLTMVQPYPYWLLKTPLAYLVGLYANDVNAGQLDDPLGEGRPQYDWLVQALRAIREAEDGRAVFLAVHYPPYSAATNFRQRGDPNRGPTRWGRKLRPLAMILEEAFQESGQFPDAVFSAHAHQYQRITYTQPGGRQIPYLIVGSGGHSPIENLARSCDEEPEPGPAPTTPCATVLPEGLSLSEGASAQLVAYNHLDFGFLRLTLDAGKKRLLGEFFAAYSESRDPAGLPELNDSFSLDLEEHRVK